MGIAILATLGLRSYAEACSCSGGSIERRTIPSEGATDFPTDGRIRVFITGGVSGAVLARLGEDYRLRGPDGRLIALSSSAQATLLTLAPAAPLAPKRRYTLERVYAYDEGGQRLTDDEHYRAARWPDRRIADQRAATRRWFPELAFTTAAGPGQGRPTAPTIKSAKVHFMYGGGDCGPGSSISIELTARDGRPFDVLGLEFLDLGVVAYAPPGDTKLWVGEHACARDPVSLPASEHHQVRVRVIAANGVETVPDAWTPVVPDRPYNLEDARGMADLARGLIATNNWELAQARRLEREQERALVERFFLRPSEPEAKGPPRVGPAHCPYGLGTLATIQVPSKALPSMWGTQISIGTVGATTLLIGEDERERTAELVAVDAAGTSKVTALGSPTDETVADFGVDGSIVASTVFDSLERSLIRVRRVDRSAKIRWTTDLEGSEVRWHPRVVWGGDRVLVAWSTTGAELGWALLDAQTGRATDNAERLPLDPNGIYAIAHDGRSFWVTWLSGGGRRQTGSLVALDAQGHAGQPRPFPEAAPDSSPTSLDLACGDHRCVLAVVSAQGLELRFLEGGTLGGPISLKAPVAPGSVRVAAFADDWYVLWTAGGDTYLTAFDAEGRWAEPATVARGDDVLRPGISAGKGRVDLAYRSDRGPTIERFGCRDVPSSAAPVQLPRLP